MDFHLRYGRPGDALDAAKLASGKAPDDVRVLLSIRRAQMPVATRSPPKVH